MSQLPEGRKPLLWKDIPFSERPKAYPSSWEGEAKVSRITISRLEARVAELEAVLQGMIGGKVYVAGHGFVETNESRAARAALKQEGE